MLGRFDFLFREGAPQLVLVVRQDLVQTVDVESGLPQERLQNLTDSPATFHSLPFVREIGLSRGNCVVVIPVTGGLQRSCPGSGGKEKWHILPVGEVHDQHTAFQGGDRRNAPWARVSASRSERMRLNPSR